jgi:acetolactate synthase-1/2/3 large subunit
LASDVWEAIKDEDWVLTVNPIWGQANRLWNFDKPYRWPGVMGGMQTGRTISASLGIALAHKGTGRLVVDMQNDGDLLYAPGALWTAANQELPMLIVMNNNRSYGNDWGHQIRVAQHRGRPVENARIGQEINDPPPDFAAIARGFGIHAEGPIEDPNMLAGALARAIEVVKQGKPALVDVVTAGRYE